MADSSDTPLPTGKDFDLRDIDLNLLVIFETIYSTLNISQAARSLGMSQPTVSNALARLRLQFDDRLFIRADRGVVPTSFARYLIQPVQGSLAVLRGGLQSMTRFDVANAKRTFTIAMHDVAMPVMLPSVLNEIDREAPGIRIDIVNQDWANPYELLASGKADLSIDVFPHDDEGVVFVPLRAIEHVIVARKGHPTMDGTMTREQFSSVGHVVLPQAAQLRLRFANVFLAAGATRREVCTVPNGSDIGPIVAATDLVALMPRRWAEAVSGYYDLQIIEPPFSCPSTELFAGWKAERTADAGLKWLRNRLFGHAMMEAREDAA